ncbi:uncharacterized, partial [Tachysurus ichikawai]
RHYFDRSSGVEPELRGEMPGRGSEPLQVRATSHLSVLRVEAESWRC